MYEESRRIHTLVLFFCLDRIAREWCGAMSGERSNAYRSIVSEEEAAIFTIGHDVRRSVDLQARGDLLTPGYL